MNEDIMNYYNSLETKIEFIVDKKYEKSLKNPIKINELITCEYDPKNPLMTY